jgi:hypothetical protein
MVEILVHAIMDTLEALMLEDLREYDLVFVKGRPRALEAATPIYDARLHWILVDIAVS